MTQVAGPHFALLFGKRICLLLDAKVLSIKAGKRNLRADRAEVTPLASSFGSFWLEVLRLTKPFCLPRSLRLLAPAGTKQPNEGSV